MLLSCLVLADQVHVECHALSPLQGAALDDITSKIEHAIETTLVSEGCSLGMLLNRSLQVASRLKCL